MPRHIHLHPHLSVVELERRYRSAHDPNERTWSLFCHLGMAPCRSAVGNREIMDEVRMYVIRRPHGVIPEFLGLLPKMTEEG